MSPRHERARAHERRNGHALEVVLLPLALIVAAMHLLPSRPARPGPAPGVDSPAQGRAGEGAR